MSVARVAAVVLLLTLVASLRAGAQIKAHVPAGITPAWNKGIQPISSESYWNAVECGKQGGDRPPCVFYDADLCKNEDFTLALFTPYKFVAYTVWQAVRKKQPPPTPSYADAQRTRPPPDPAHAGGGGRLFLLPPPRVPPHRHYDGRTGRPLEDSQLRRR